MELALSVVPFALLWLVMVRLVDSHYGLVLILAVPAAGFLIRLFLIQHDCGHGSFFVKRRANEWIGRCAGVLTLSPYAYWRRVHSMHHAGTGNLDRRGIGDVDTLTLREFHQMGSWRRLRYRVYRNPVILFGLGPVWLFLIQYRLPVGLMRNGWRPWLSAMGNNCAIGTLYAAMILAVGLRTFLLVQGPILLLASTVGVWLFYIQHQFEQTQWRHAEEWTFEEAALLGSSHYTLPVLLQWFTANVGIHHLHHLHSTIPFYRLPAALKMTPELSRINRLTFRDSLRSVNLVLWDESASRLVTFREARRVNGLQQGGSGND
ncbi:fatty acid desaturase [Sphingomonas ginkgonis]|uniref:Fatty acid desaturase n=1 Tax=Sphingomonas ginkgonis TaxID=2315330 RepID=A0A429VEF6_9SPHN|nr:fatty acid desaturase [Sphingomonas ginkgonis]RST32232.1 fatty acid desaturase [Sphingomonas ginkgonis]